MRHGDHTRPRSRRCRRPRVHSTVASENGNPSAENDVRELLRGALKCGVTAEYLDDLLEKVKEATFRTKAHCPECRSTVYPEAPDYSKTVRMLADLVDQAHGRSRTDGGGGDGATTIIMEYGLWAAGDMLRDLATDEERATVKQAEEILARLNAQNQARQLEA